MKLRHILGGLALALTAWFAQAASLVVLPQQLVVDVNGDVRSGAKLWTYQCGTLTPLTTYTTPAIAVAHANPVLSVSTGLFPAIYTAANTTCIKLTLTDSADVAIYTEDNLPAGGSALWPLDVRSFGVVADSTAARAANSAALIAMVDASEAGAEGRVIFPNPDGTTTYFFDAVPIQIRDRITLDLNGSTLDFAGDFTTDNNLFGFLNCIRDCVIETGSINVDYDGSAGTNNGMAIRLGSRNAYPFGADLDGIEDEDLATRMGNILIRNMRITSNNAVPLILALGGLDNVAIENIVGEGSGVATRCFFYEWGDWHFDATAADRESSHARNLALRTIHCNDLVSTSAPGVRIAGALSASIDGLWVDDASAIVEIIPGEANYFNMGTPYVGMKAHADLRNINGKNIVSGSGVLFTGAQAASGYLAAVIGALDPEPEAKATTDLLTFSLDGCSLNDTGISTSASGTIRNCDIDGGSSGGVVITDEAIDVLIEMSKVRNSGNVGIRADFGSAIWSPARPKRLTARNNIIAGNTGAGITIQNSGSARIESNRFNYLQALDDLSETTQTSAISVSATGGNGVIADGNSVALYAAWDSGTAYVIGDKVSLAGVNYRCILGNTNQTPPDVTYWTVVVAYALAGNSDRGNEIRNPQGLASFSGNWKIDGVARDTATNIADDSAAINTTNKYAGKLVYDTSNNRMLMAQGPAATDTWITVSDFGAGDTVVTVTPS